MADPRLGTELAGYRIESLLARGGMSVVYRARDMRLGRDVALKLLAHELAEDERFRTRFLRESRIAASLHHPSIVPVYAAGEVDGLLYLAMRFVEGSDLRALLRRDGPLEPSRALALLDQVADALDAAHRRGLVHRDVKPANVLIERGGDAERAYLADFGLTKTDASAGGSTAAGQLIGTIDYVAPEQIRGEEVDGRADVYSLGCVIHECLTGSPPFGQGADVAVIYAHLQEEPPAASERRSELPRQIDAVLARALAKDRRERYATAGDLAAAARAALALPRGRRGLTRLTRSLGRTGPRLRARVFVATLLGVALALAGVGCGSFDRFERESMDRRFDIRGPQDPPAKLAVVGIDEATIRDFRRGWPFPRSYHGRVIERLREDGARVIAYDIQFTFPAKNADEDEALAKAVARAPDKVVLATTETEQVRSRVFGHNRHIFGDPHARLGNPTLPIDADGATRRLFYGSNGLKSFGLAVAELASGRTITFEDAGGGNGVWIDFLGPPGTVPHYSFSRVMNGRFDRGTFRDAVVVVGATARALQDLHRTPGGERMDGPELQASVASTALAGFPLHAPDWPAVPVAVVALALLGALARSRLRLVPAVGAGLLVAASYLVLAQAAFNAGFVLPVVAPLVALGLTVALSD